MNYLDFFQPNDNTTVVLKPTLSPLHYQQRDTRSIITEGTHSGSNAKLELYGQLEKEQKDLQQGLTTIGAALDYTSPSYWVNKNGGNLNTAESLGLDLTVYIALGGLTGLVKRGLVTLTKNGIKPTTNFLVKATKQVPKQELEKYGAFRVQKVISTPSSPVPSNYRAPLDGLYNDARQTLINYYYSDDYKHRLLEAGFTEKEANERITQLIKNTNTPITNQQLEGVAGVTNIRVSDPNLVSIVIDGNNMEAGSAVLEELIHASELNGFTLNDLMRDPAFWKLTDEQKEKAIYAVSNLHNEKALPYNKGLQPVVNQNVNPQLKNYFSLPHETRARATGKILEEPTLGNEWDLVYTGNKKEYLDKMIGLGIPLLIDKE